MRRRPWIALKTGSNRARNAPSSSAKSLAPGEPGSAWRTRRLGIRRCWGASALPDIGSGCTDSITGEPFPWTALSSGHGSARERPGSRIWPAWKCRGSVPRSGACGWRRRDSWRNWRPSASPTIRAGRRWHCSAIPRWPRRPYLVEGRLWEFPPPVAGFGPFTVPLWGWGLRTLPEFWLQRRLRALAGADAGTPLTLHPWELDAEQPAIPEATWGHRFAHGAGLREYGARLRRMLRGMDLVPIEDWLGSNV